MIGLIQHNNRQSHSETRRVSFTPSDTGCVDCDFDSWCPYGLQQSNDMLARKGSINCTTMQQTIWSKITTDTATASCGPARDFKSSKTLEVKQFPRDVSSIYHELPLEKHDNFDFEEELRNIFLVQHEERGRGIR